MALKSLRDVNQKVVAIGTLAVLGAALVFAFAIGPLHLFDKGYTMGGYFTDQAGIKKGDDVRVAGVKAGRVTDVKPDFAHGRVLIEWHVNAGIDLGRDTRADIETTTLLGGRYMKLSGPVAKPYLANLPESRRRVPLEHTSVPFTVPEALQNTQNIVGKLDEKSMSKLLAEVSQIKSPGAAKLNRILRNIQDLSRTLNDSYPQIQNLIEASKNITGTLASKDDELRQIIDAGQVLLQSLVDRRNELAATIGQGSRTVRTLDNVISKNQGKLDTLLDNLHLLTTRLAPNMDALNTDFSLLGPTFQQVANLKGNGPWIEGVLTGLGPIQPPGPISTRRSPAGQGGN
jgi:phospholipid/cholesterol/gamma-HCH transport system substrate-binding protein